MTVISGDDVFSPAGVRTSDLGTSTAFMMRRLRRSGSRILGRSVTAAFYPARTSLRCWCSSPAIARLHPARRNNSLRRRQPG
jgi:hypothetical protein